MKIILSRKGFDTSNGGIPSPIMPNGTLLSFPIPSKNDTLSFSDLKYDSYTYSEILRQLAPKRKYDKCHFDPDIRDEVWVKGVPKRNPAFGQIGAAQGVLAKNNVKQGDLFLFFGRFQQTRGDIAEGTLCFDKKTPILHVVYGYLEIGEIVTADKIAAKNYTWHPHGFGNRLSDRSNAIYLPTEDLSFDKTRRGWGAFKLSKKLILTLSDKTGTWREVPALMPENIATKRKNSAEGLGVYYKGIWQEMVLKENDVSVEWARDFFI